MFQTYMKTNYISTVRKGPFSVIYYVANTVILCFIIHCMYALCLFSACYACSLIPAVRGPRCIVFNKDLFCSNDRLILACILTA